MIPDYSSSAVVVEQHDTYWYGNYWGPAYDPYLYDLYGCRWGYGGFYAGGYIYGGGPWYYHHGHGWHDHWHDDQCEHYQPKDNGSRTIQLPRLARRRHPHLILCIDFALLDGLLWDFQGSPVGLVGLT